MRKLFTVLITCLLMVHESEVGAISFMSANVDRPMKGPGKIQSYAVKSSTHLYKGQLICIDGTGYAVRASDSLNKTFVGVAVEEVNNTGGDAAKWIKVYRDGIFRFTAFSVIPQSRLGRRAYAADDNQVEEYSGDAHLCYVGTIVECDPEGTGTYAWVDISAGCNCGLENGVWADVFASQ